MGYISDTARNRTHNLFRSKREPIPLGHSDGHITLQFIKSHHITFHSITSHRIASHCITSHSITLHHIALHYITSHHITLQFFKSHHITFHSIPFHSIPFHSITSHHIESHYITSHHITSHHITSLKWLARFILTSTDLFTQHSFCREIGWRWMSFPGRLVGQLVPTRTGQYHDQWESHDQQGSLLRSSRPLLPPRKQVSFILKWYFSRERHFWFDSRYHNPRGALMAACSWSPLHLSWCHNLVSFLYWVWC